MREWITGRNPVYEVLRAHRRQSEVLWVAQGAKEHGRLAEIINLSHSLKIPVKFVPRSDLDGIDPHHQAVALNTSGYPYSDLETIIKTACRSREL